MSVDSAELAEGDSTAVRLEITNGVTYADEQEVRLEFAGSTAARGSDFTVSPESLTLGAGAKRATATVTAATDSDPEGEETVLIAATLGGEALGTVTLTISDGDVAALTAQFEGMPETHDGQATFRFLIP